MLAIIAPNFNQVSEIFVADHAANLAPGHTVLICGDSPGAERFGHPVLSHLAPHYSHFSPAGKIANALRFRLRRRGGYGPLLAFENRMRLIEFLRAHKVTVMLCEFGNLGPVIGDTCRQLGIPFYVIFRGNDAAQQLQNRSSLRRQRRVFRQTAGVFAVSRHLADQLAGAGCPEELLHVAPSGMDPGQFHPGTPEPGRIVAVGRLVEKKAPHLTLRAFARIAERFPEARLDIIGEGGLQARCEAVIEEENLAGRVTLHGAQPHEKVAELLQRAAIFAQHSVTDSFGQTEGFPGAIAEAMGSALPVVATRHAGIPEHVHEGKNGFLVDEGDVTGMSEAMATLLADPERAAAMGQTGRAWALENLTRRATHRRLWQVMDLENRLGVPMPAS
jgi:colanic acid/amylovoran biosynthesis glycosyltransferase